MLFEIKNRTTLVTIFKADAESIKATVLLAVKSRADLYGANLSRADLSGADLSGVNLSGVNLYGANLSGVNLSRANLSGVNLSRANLSGADLSGVNLSGANLSGVNLSRANLSGANLSRADLYGANLSGVNLSRANLSGANLSRADLSGANKIPLLAAAQTSIVPEEGLLTGWKKCKNNVLVKLLVGKKAKRSNATGRKCRAEYVKVLSVIGAEVGISSHDSKTEYRTGAIVRCDKWEEDRWVECGGGIHFFLTRIEAENY
jgi:hypothetical protein